MVWRSNARVAVRQGSGGVLGERNEVLDRARLPPRMRDQGQRAPCRERDGPEIVHGVVGQALEEARIHDERIDRQHQGVAVRLGFRHDVAADVARRARQIFHDSGSAQARRQTLGQEARDHVGTARRCDARRFGRLVGKGAGRSAHESDAGGREEGTAHHGREIFRSAGGGEGPCEHCPPTASMARDQP